MLDLSMDKMPKISFKAAKANPEVIGDADEFRARVQYFRFKQGQPVYEFNKGGSREKGSFIEAQIQESNR